MVEGIEYLSTFQVVYRRLRVTKYDICRPRMCFRDLCKSRSEMNRVQMKETYSDGEFTIAASNMNNGCRAEVMVLSPLQ